MCSARKRLLIAGLLLAMTGSPAWAWKPRRCPPAPVCPPGEVLAPAPSVPPSTTPPSPTEPQPPAPPSDVPDAIDESLSSSLETASSPQSMAPSMLGDLFGTGGNFFLGFENGAGQGVSANNSTPVNGGRRLKIGEYVSPMPRDRLFFSYNLFRGAYRTQAPAGGVNPLGLNTGGNTGAPGTPGVPGLPGLPGTPGTGGAGFGPEGAGARNFDVNRFTFGFEKTFLNGMVSVEARLPFSRTLSTDLFISDDGTIPGETATELDNTSVTLKTLVYRRRNLALSTGVVINMPTADDIFITQQFNDVNGGIPIGHTVLIRNESLHLGPFFGYLYTPTDRLFIQGFVQGDLPVNGNDTTFVPINGGVAGAPQDGTLDDQNLLQIDFALGYWIYRSEDSWFRGVAPIVEWHYTTTTDNAPLLVFTNAVGNYQSIVGNTLNRLDIHNLTVGMAVQVGDRGTISSGAVIPLNRGDHSFLFDWEYQLQFNYRFGKLRGPDSPIYN